MIDQRKEKIYQEVKQEIRSILISSPKCRDEGLSLFALCQDYKQFNSGKELPYLQLGFPTLSSFLRSMPDVVQMVFIPTTRSYRLYGIEDESTAHIQKFVLEQRDPRKFNGKVNHRWNRSFHLNEYVQVWNNYRDEISSNLSTNRFVHQNIFSSSNRFELKDYLQVNELVNDERNPIQFEEKNSQRDDQHLIEYVEDSDISMDDEDQYWRNRIHRALFRCIEFRYHYHLCQLEFQYRHYPSSVEISLRKSQCQQQFFETFQEELQQFQILFEKSPSIDDHLCRQMFDEYVHLQRKYSYMMKLIRKFHPETKSLI